MSLDEFEKNIKDSYLAVQNSPEEIDCTVETIENKSARAVYDEIEQRVYADYGTFFIRAEIFSGTGESGTYTYRKVDELGVYRPSSGSLYFYMTNAQYSFNSARTICTAKYTGTIYNTSGIELTTRKTYTMKFYAN